MVIPSGASPLSPGLGVALTALRAVLLFEGPAPTHSSRSRLKCHLSERPSWAPISRRPAPLQSLGTTSPFPRGLCHHEVNLRLLERPEGRDPPPPPLPHWEAVALGASGMNERTRAGDGRQAPRVPQRRLPRSRARLTRPPAPPAASAPGPAAGWRS